MILVTGAAGKTGRAVIRALVVRGAAVRALVHRAAQRAGVTQAGAREVVTGDMRAASDLLAALEGVRAVYHIPPNVSPDEVTMGEAVIEATRTAGAEHFVYHSVLHPQVGAMPHHWLKLRVEEALFASGLPYTILQPTAYMQNVLGQWRSIVGEGRYVVPYAVETRLSLVDLGDVAEVAALVLTTPGHLWATYELVGTEPLSQTEIAAQLSRALARPVHAAALSRKVWAEQSRAAGLGEYQVETLLKMFRYYERFGFSGNSRVMEQLLGRPARSFRAFAAEAADGS
ncbi:MAG: NmrA family NAD(P)-binding protein [Anaerolineales bacterium]